jgi:hypothetical protein
MADSKLKIWITDSVKLTGMKKMLKSVNDFRKKAGKAFDAIGDKIKKALLSPQTLISAGFIGLGAKITQWALNASGDMEMMKTQLETVMSSAEEAAAAFDESLKFSVKTPFNPQEIVQTRILLESVGVSGGEAVEAVAEAAGAMNRNIQDVATAVISMETEPLRRLGIGLSRNADDFVFTFKNKMGEAVKVTANSFEEAQQAVLDIFQEKFSGGVSKMAETWEGLKSTLGGVRDLFFAELGDGFMPQAKQIVKDIIELLEAGIDSGKIEEIGEQIGQWIEKVRDDAIRVLSEIRSLDDLKIVFDEIGKWLLEKLQEGGQKAAAFLAEKAPGIGAAIGDAAKDSLLGFFKGEIREGTAELMASKSMFGKNSPGIFNKASYGLDPEYNQKVKFYESALRQEELATAGKAAAAQIEISDQSQQSLAERITTALAAKAKDSAGSNDISIQDILAAGPTLDQLDELVSGMEMTAEELDQLIEYTEQAKDSAGSTTEAAKKSADAATKASQANKDATDTVTTAMRQSADASRQMKQVGQENLQVSAELAGAVAQMSGQLNQIRTDLGIAFSQIESMRT